ncbi:MAG: hypothetical protein FWE03_02495 [Firmicutes bacterium]|nr:hypothetical protein [Bacillota bacterium]
MIKKITAAIIFASILLLPVFTLSACNFAQFMQYTHQEGMTILLMDDDNRFKTQFHFAVQFEGDEPSNVAIKLMDDFLFDLLEENLTGNLTRQEPTIIIPAQNVLSDDVDAPARILFIFELERARGNENYRFDTNLAPIISANDEPRAFFNSRTTVHTNPFNKIDFHYELINNEISPFYDNEDIAFNTLVALARNRSDIENGQRVAYDAFFYAEFRGNLNDEHKRLKLSFDTMIAWQWFLLAGGITLIIVGGILLLAKKGSGRVVKVNRIVANRFGKIVTIDAAGMPINEGEVFNELGNDEQKKDVDVFEGF